VFKSKDIESNTISYNTQGIYCVDYSSPTITWNDIHNNTDAGVNCTSGSNPVIHYNNIEDNLKDLNDPQSGYGVNNRDPIYVTIDAINNWWGDDSGPYHQTSNPDGEGNQVSNGVIFIPFSGQSY